MLWTLAAVLLMLWAIGLISGYTIGGWLNILLIVALVVVTVQVMQRRRRA